MATGSTAVLEPAAEAKPDAIVIDAQHGLWDRQSIGHAVGAVLAPRAGMSKRDAEMRVF